MPGTHLQSGPSLPPRQLSSEFRIPILRAQGLVFPVGHALPACLLPFMQRGTLRELERRKTSVLASICLQKCPRWGSSRQGGDKAGTFHIQAEAGRPRREPWRLPAGAGGTASPWSVREAPSLSPAQPQVRERRDSVEEQAAAGEQNSRLYPSSWPDVISSCLL